MDAHDEDSKAPPGPDGSDGTRPRPGPDSTDGPGEDRADRPGPVEDRRDRPDPGEDRPAPGTPRTGVAALSPRYQVGAALALAVVAVTACVHLGMVFLHVAPANTVTKQHGRAIDEWIYPEFEQNWKLFAPNPLQQNIAVEVRAELWAADGTVTTTGWYDLSAQDGEAIDGSLLPSHTEQNELRRAWDFFLATHGSDNRPVGLRGSLSEEYLRRIVVRRLYTEDGAGKGVVRRVQLRSRTTDVPPPSWSREQVSDKPYYRLLPWWTVTRDETAGGVR
ncbi:DUF5819 family protein [Streptomyces sp. NPDC001544]|uniref:DUF5819 family protein n=1 Tax=Streptomyces sp. NPDC001544 TaxID=3364584 RepID=UPI003688B303